MDVAFLRGHCLFTKQDTFRGTKTLPDRGAGCKRAGTCRSALEAGTTALTSLSWLPESPPFFFACFDILHKYKWERELLDGEHKSGAVLSTFKDETEKKEKSA